MLLESGLNLFLLDTSEALMKTEALVPIFTAVILHAESTVRLSLQSDILKCPNTFSIINSLYSRILSARLKHADTVLSMLLERQR